MTKKQTKQLIVLVSLLIICIAGYLGANHYYQVKSEKAEEESLKEAKKNKKVAFQMKNADNITGLAYAVDGETIMLLKDTDGTWMCSSDATVTLDQNKVKNSMVEKLAYIASEDNIKKPEDTSQYGFDKPTNQIVISDIDGNSYVFIIGKQNEFDTEKYYMMVEGDDNVYVVDSTIPNAFSSGLSDLKQEEATTLAE